jgi:hypothetical protein
VKLVIQIFIHIKYSSYFITIIINISKRNLKMKNEGWGNKTNDKRSSDNTKVEKKANAFW